MTDKSPRSPSQLVFHLPLTPGMGREDFFVSQANHEAFELIEKWPGESNRSHLLVLTGPVGSGKSHLAEIWRARTSAARASVADVTVENVPRLLAAGALVIEDAPGEGLDERAMFHLINMARETSAAILVTSRGFPSRWPVALPDLKSRLKAALVAELGRPDDELLRAVLVKLFADRQLRIGEETVSYMLTRMERSLATARDLVDEIDRRALAEKANVTRAFVSRIMREHRQADPFDEE